MSKLLSLIGYKLPCEEVWVTADDMYEVYSPIRLSVDNERDTDFIITEIVEQGLYIEIVH